jgi:hypothetical protein
MEGGVARLTLGAPNPHHPDARPKVNSRSKIGSPLLIEPSTP